MADQIVFQAANGRTRINEHSAYAVIARFRNRATAADVTPTNVQYRLDCLATGKAIADWATASPDEEVTITTTPAQNAIQDDCNALERKQLTVSADRGLATEFNETFVYEVANLQGIT